MMRWSVLIAGTVAVLGAAFVTGASVPTKGAKPPEAARADDKPPVVIGQKTGYFNMAKVMREYKRARTSVERLNARKNRLAANLLALKAMHTEVMAAAQKTQDADKKFELERDARTVARRIEDLDREINKILNERASLIIVELYDDIYAVTAALAREHNLTAVLAYPDAVTPEERESPFVKELKLKPPAAQPFYLDSSVEFSDEIIRRLNEKLNDEDDSPEK
jgi:Skp family chaperone for outer membrane proteins